MKVKLLKIDTADAVANYHNTGVTFYFSPKDRKDLIVDSTEWEDVSDNEYNLLCDFVRENREYILVSEPEEKEIIKLSIQKMLEIHKERKRLREMQEKRDKARAFKAQETRKANKLKRLKEELAKLES